MPAIATATRPRTIARAWGLAIPYESFSTARPDEGRKYGKPADWEFRLFCGKGSLKSTAKDSTTCIGMVDHGCDPQFGDASLGPVTLFERDEGLFAILNVRDDNLGHEFVRCLRRKQFRGMSVSYMLYPLRHDVVPSKHGHLDTVLVHDFGIISEVSFCRNPGFRDTYVQYTLL